VPPPAGDSDTNRPQRANIREKARETHCTVVFVNPTTRFQNIKSTPPTAASAEARGMIVSGPIYMLVFS